MCRAGSCRVAECEPCLEDDDCAEGSRCVRVLDGDEARCLPACGPEGCDDGTRCVELGRRQVCVPDGDGDGFLLEGCGGTDCDDGNPDANRRGRETCNERDDDCDGEVDEGLGVPLECVAGVGACARSGLRRCTPEGEAFCGAEPGDPGVELCGNERDDDCDGGLDEGFDELGTPCAAGVGGCRREGTVVCSEDGHQAVCGAIPGEPEEELCNEEDDDCNGEVDDPLDVGQECEVGVGPCSRRGVLECALDGSVRCSAHLVDPTPEACDGRDNDCDGRVDEGLTRPCETACGRGDESCVNGGWSGCSARDAEPERCNDADDDCDGLVDEDLDLMLVGPRVVGAGDGGGNAGAAPAVVQTDAGFLVLSSGRSGPEGRGPYETSLHVLDADGDALLDVVEWRDRQAHVVATADGFLAFSHEHRLGVGATIHALDAVGRPVGNPRAAQQARADGFDLTRHSPQPAAVWLGGLAPSVVLQRFRADGVEIPGVVAVSREDREARWPAVEGAGDGYGVLWTTWPPAPGTTLYYRYVSGDGEPQAEAVPVTTSLGMNRHAQASWSGERMAIVWQSDRSGDEDIYVAVVDRDGEPVAEEVRLTSSPINSTYPDIVWDGASFRVSWVEHDAIRERVVRVLRLSADGVPEDRPMTVGHGFGGQGARLSAGHERLAIAFYGSLPGSSQGFFAAVACQR